MTETSPGRGPRQRQVEIGVAVATLLFGILVIFGALKVGITWGIEGPRAGFFPFYLGVVIVIASAINFIQIFPEVREDRLFAEWQQLRSVVSVAIPTAIYVLLVPWLGIYVASLLLLAVFMKWVGRFGWRTTIMVALAVPLVTYVIFEKWFLIPLPKGPLESLLNL